MNQTIDFSQLPLRDIHLPGAIAWWPPALGWWLVATLALATLAFFALRFYARRQHRTALRAVRRVRAALEQGTEPVACLAQLSTVIRRFVMTTASRSAADTTNVAGLVGDRWLAYLDGRWQRDVFRYGDGRQLLAAPYARPGSANRDDALRLAQLCEDWLRSQPARGP